MLICPICEAENLEDTEFCQMCGAPLEDDLAAFRALDAPGGLEPPPLPDSTRTPAVPVPASRRRKWWDQIATLAGRRRRSQPPGQPSSNL